MNLDLLYPVFAQVALTIILAVVVGSLRFHAVSSKAVKLRDIVMGQRAWPKPVQKWSNALNNQWETPTLFYAAIGFAMLVGAQSPLLVPAAWLYVVSRLVHVAIYATSNYLPVRFGTFIVGVIALVTFWVAFSVEFVSR
jgi:hypothetical protein